MKILVATDQGQTRPGDFSWTEPGELVTLGFVCDADLENPDGGCGCGRAFTGLDSRKATTTAEVRDVDMTLVEYVQALRDSDAAAGFTVDPSVSLLLAEEITATVADMPVGVIVRRRLDDILPND